MMGGRIWVDSAPGKGSQFHFTTRFKHPAALEGTGAGMRASEKVRAIVIHPIENRRSHLAAMLEAWNVETAVVSSAATALDVIDWSARVGRPFGFAIVDRTSALENGCALGLGLREGKNPLPFVAVAEADAAPGGEELQAAATFTWPVSQSSLLEAVFRFTRPAAVKTPPLPVGVPRPSVIPYKGPAMRILVAEDIPENRELVIALFEDRNDILRLVTNGREALEACQTDVFDLILMDMQMPEMGGVEATAAIRTLETATGVRTPIIALTAHAMKGDRERYLSCDMDGYVSKPIRPDDLFREIDRVVPPGSLLKNTGALLEPAAR